RNSRIGRLWPEVGSQFGHRWKAFFSRLERLHSLGIEKSAHTWLLRTLFMDAISEDCEKFQAEWNLRPISGPTANNKKPQPQIREDQLQQVRHDAVDVPQHHTPFK
ncbi:hypothetical protein L210DRAFT_785760, partial [Boletus edulis BED1]